MKLICTKSRLRGDADIPGSKSHTIRAVAIAALAPGESRIESPLVSADTLAAVDAYRRLGAEINTDRAFWTVHGVAGRPSPPRDVIDVKNSGTTLRVALGSAALLTEGSAVLTGDEQICVRPIGPLVDSLNDLGASVSSEMDNGCAPLIVEQVSRELCLLANLESGPRENAGCDSQSDRCRHLNPVSRAQDDYPLDGADVAATISPPSPTAPPRRGAGRAPGTARRPDGAQGAASPHS